MSSLGTRAWWVTGSFLPSGSSHAASYWSASSMCSGFSVPVKSTSDDTFFFHFDFPTSPPTIPSPIPSLHPLPRPLPPSPPPVPSPHPRPRPEEDLSSLCEQVVHNLEECLGYDLQLFQDTCQSRAEAALAGSLLQTEEGAGDVGTRSMVDGLMCLSSDLVLKLAALSILPSHTLRIQGVYIRSINSLLRVTILEKDDLDT